jgi:hypothetical protein
MKNIQLGDVTETLIKATEQVSEQETSDVVVILYNRNSDPVKMRCVCSDGVTIETANWMLDKAKAFLIIE